MSSFDGFAKLGYTSYSDKYIQVCWQKIQRYVIHFFVDFFFILGLYSVLLVCVCIHISNSVISMSSCVYLYVSQFGIEKLETELQLFSAPTKCLI